MLLVGALIVTALMLGVVVPTAVGRGRAARFAPVPGALAERSVEPLVPFALQIPASGPIVVTLTLRAESNSERLKGWGVTTSLHGERAIPQAEGSYRRAPEPFRFGLDVSAGADAPGTESGLPRAKATVLDSAWSGSRLSARISLIEIPAGEAFTLRGVIDVCTFVDATTLRVAVFPMG